MEAKIEFRYEKSGNAYLPMFKQPQFSDDWKYFNKNSFERESILGVIAAKIASINCSDWSGGLYHFKSKDDVRVFFKTEIQVMAFLGAAKSYWSTRIEEFSI